MISPGCCPLITPALPLYRTGTSNLLRSRLAWKWRQSRPLHRSKREDDTASRADGRSFDTNYISFTDRLVASTIARTLISHNRHWAQAIRITEEAKLTNGVSCSAP